MKGIAHPRDPTLRLPRLTPPLMESQLKRFIGPLATFRAASRWGTSRGNRVDCFHACGTQALTYNGGDLAGTREADFAVRVPDAEGDCRRSSWLTGQ